MPDRFRHQREFILRLWECDLDAVIHNQGRVGEFEPQNMPTRIGARTYQARLAKTCADCFVYRLLLQQFSNILPEISPYGSHSRFLLLSSDFCPLLRPRLVTAWVIQERVERSGDGLLLLA